MRVIHVISSPVAGGAEVFAKDLSKAMANSGHSLSVVFISGASELGRDTTFEKLFLDELSEAGIAYKFIGHKARKIPILGIYKLWEISAQFKPDIVHNHLSYAVVFSILLRKPKLIFTYHNNVIKEPKIFFKFIDYFIDEFVGISEVCQKTLSSMVPGKVQRIDNGVDTNRLIRKGEKQENPIFTIAMVGHLSKQKNYTLAIEVVARLHDLDFKLLIAGEGPDRAKITELISSQGLQGKVQLMGNLVDIPSYLHSCDLFLMTSDWEGLPIGLIEATLCGLPVVVTDTGGCAELVEEVGNGIVAPAQDSKQLAAAVRVLIENNTLRTQYSENAIKNSTRYTIERSSSEYLSLYTSLLGSHLRTTDHTPS